MMWARVTHKKKQIYTSRPPTNTIDPWVKPMSNKTATNEVPGSRETRKRKKPRRLRAAYYDTIVNTADGAAARAGLTNNDRKLNNVLAAFTDQTNKKHNAIMKALKDFKETKNALRAVSTPNLRKYAIEKLASHGDSLEHVKEELSKAGVKIPEGTLLSLIAIDDWSALWSFAKPLLAKHGLDALKWAYDKIRTKLKPIGGDEGFNSIDWDNGNSILGPRRIALAPGVNVSMTGIRNTEDYKFDLYSINANAIKTTICPELEKHRYTYPDGGKVAFAVPVCEFSVVSSVNGNVGVVIWPKLVCGSGGISFSYAVIFNAADFSVQTGSQSTATSTFIPGPMQPNVAMIDSMRVTSTGVQFIPTSSYNTSGSFTMSANPRTSMVTSTTQIGLNLATQKTQPYVTSFNSKTQARMLGLITDSADDMLAPTYPSNPTNQNIILLGSGLPPGVEVGRFVISAMVEFIPNYNYFHMCFIDFPTPGPDTEKFESMMFAKYPILQSLDLVDAKKVATALPSGTVHYDELYSALTSALTGIQPRAYHSHSDNSVPSFINGQPPVVFGNEDIVSLSELS
jgi:hypothetical protein